MKWQSRRQLPVTGMSFDGQPISEFDPRRWDTELPLPHTTDQAVTLFGPRAPESATTLSFRGGDERTDADWAASLSDTAHRCSRWRGRSRTPTTLQSKHSNCNVVACRCGHADTFVQGVAAGRDRPPRVVAGARRLR